jgi:hypothetical protein
MRAVWVAMRDEDPPDRGLADLLAAARHQATAARPRPGAWQRLLAALRRPPVLAFATVTVLIAGAMLIGRRVPHHAAPASVHAIATHDDRAMAPSEDAAAAPRLGAFSEAPGSAASDRVSHPARTAAARSDAGGDLYRQSETAARRGDCATVRRLVDQILQIDPGYRARVASDSPVARCLAR